jgi:hypothetical protein
MRERENTYVTIIKAEPGWFVAWYCEEYDKTPACFVMSPIIAWDVKRKTEQRDGGYNSGSHSITPITTDGNPYEAKNECAIKRPDGKFDIPHDQTLDSEQETLAYFTAIVRARAA